MTKIEQDLHPTEVQINYLKFADPLVRSAINHPLSFRTSQELSQKQIIAIQSGVDDIYEIFNKVLERTIGLVEQERSLVIAQALVFVDSQGKKNVNDWVILKRDNLIRAEELFPLINELIKVFQDLQSQGVSIREYARLFF